MAHAIKAPATAEAPSITSAYSAVVCASSSRISRLISPICRSPFSSRRLPGRLVGYGDCRQDAGATRCKYPETTHRVSGEEERIAIQADSTTSRAGKSTEPAREFESATIAPAATSRSDILRGRSDTLPRGRARDNPPSEGGDSQVADRQGDETYPPDRREYQ